MLGYATTEVNSQPVVVGSSVAVRLSLLGFLGDWDKMKWKLDAGGYLRGIRGLEADL